MDLRSAVMLTSSWNVPAEPLLNALYIKNSNGIIIEEPYSQESGSPVLRRPETSSSEPCFIYIDTHQLKGYFPIGVSFISECRTMECYNGCVPGEYIGTSRGMLVEQSENKESNIYECVINSFEDQLNSEFTLKLVSLHNRVEVKIKGIYIIVIENIGGTEPKNDTGLVAKATNDVNMLELLSGIQYNEKVALSFVPNLISSLQQLQHSKVSSPDNIKQIASMFQQMRPPPGETKPEISDSTTDKEEIEIEEEKEEKSNGVTVSQIELNILEERLKKYIDIKMKELQEHMELRLTEVHQEILRKFENKNC